VPLAFFYALSSTFQMPTPNVGFLMSAEALENYLFQSKKN